jgi:hypothetical protein
MVKRAAGNLFLGENEMQLPSRLEPRSISLADSGNQLHSACQLSGIEAKVRNPQAAKICDCSKGISLE